MSNITLSDALAALGLSATTIANVPHQTVVDRLLDRDGHQHAPHCGAEGQHQRDGQADAELRRQGQAPAQGGPGSRLGAPRVGDRRHLGVHSAAPHRRRWLCGGRRRSGRSLGW